MILYRTCMGVVVVALLAVLSCVAPMERTSVLSDDVEHRQIYEAIRAALPGKYSTADVFPSINTTGFPSVVEGHQLQFWGFRTRSDARMYYSGFSIRDPESERVQLSEILYHSDSIAAVIVDIVDVQTGFGTTDLYLLRNDSGWRVFKREVWIVHG